MSNQTTNWQFPYAELGDSANIETVAKPLSQRLETVFNTLFGGGTLTPAAVRTALGLVIGTDVQAHDADLSLYAAATTPGAQVGLNDGTTVRRGKSIIATSESRSSASYGLLTTPDRVQNVVLPTGGLIVVLYHAIWQEGSGNPGRAAIFIGANQLKVQDAAGNGPYTQAAATNGGAASTDGILCTSPQGLISTKMSVANGANVTTGQVVGASAAAGSGIGVELGGSTVLGDSGSNNAADSAAGPCYIFADPGTYDVSVQFKGDGTHSVTAKDRKLWVWTLGF